MKPRLRYSRGMWVCGLLDQPQFCWSVALTPLDAYFLWLRAQS